MSEHLLALPVVIPLVAGIVLLFAARLNAWLQRTLGLVSALSLLGVSLLLLGTAATGSYETYAMGHWQPPFGITLVSDRLSAIMLVVTSVLALPALLYSFGGEEKGPYFPALFQFQLMGLSGAFLTGDLFNLFVFFEVLLIASYALLIQGGGAARSRAGFHYVVLNLLGSLLFLIGVGILYGVTGTLNMADLALGVSRAPPEDHALLATGGLILLVVFSLKAALLPLLFWLPKTYSAALPAVAALFAIMTKVGIYSILRVYPLIFGPLAGGLEGLAWDWLWPLGLATMVLALIGILSAGSLRVLVSWQIILSVGTLLTVMSLAQPGAYGALLFYLVHTTWVTGGLFLIAGLIKNQRGDAEDLFNAAPRMRASTAVSVLYLIGAMAVIGLPPFSGLPAKVAVLQSTGMGTGTTWIWSVVIFGGLVSLIAFSRAATVMFWQHADEVPEERPRPSRPLHRRQYVAALALIICSPLLSLGAQPVLEFTQAAGEQIAAPALYINAVLDETRSVGLADVIRGED